MLESSRRSNNTSGALTHSFSKRTAVNLSQLLASEMTSWLLYVCDAAVVSPVNLLIINTVHILCRLGAAQTLRSHGLVMSQRCQSFL